MITGKWRIIKRDVKGFQIIDNSEENSQGVDWVFPEDLKRYGPKTPEEELQSFGFELDDFGKEDV